MLQYGEIIEKLSIDEKLAILTDGSFLAAAHTENEQIPALSICKASEISETDEYPSFGALANTWSASSVENVAQGLAVRAKLSNVNAVLLPEGNVRSNVYENGVSEDPYLLGTLLGKFVKATSNVGVMPILTNCALTSSNVAYADVKPNARAILEYYLRAFAIAAKGQEVAISTSYTYLKGDYEDVNVKIVPALIEKHVAGKESFLLCEETASEKAVERVNAGYSLCVRGHAHALKEAVVYCEALQTSVEAGVASAEELEEALQEGKAIREDTIDEAVDNVLRFARACELRAKTDKEGITEPTAAELLSITEKTAVLLKNQQNVLPIKHKKVAVIGQLASVGEEKSSLAYIENLAGKDFVGYEQGYDFNRNRSDDLILMAKELAQKADVLFVFLGFDEARESRLLQTKCLKLLGSQAALLDALGKLGKKIVAVVTGSGRLDMQFDSVADAVMYMPSLKGYGGEAVARLLYGKACPSGKLPFTMYNAPDARVSRERFYKNGGYNKVGTFVGYRRYDSDREVVKYPFGHGLSYTKFAYSNLRINGKSVSVTVKNVGNVEGTETVQFYYGKDKATQIRPRKQLFDFAQVTLKPGQEKTVSIELTQNAFSFYDPQTDKWEVEKGPYKIYASNSVSDERLKCLCNELGTSPTPSKEKTAEYLQGKSNIVSGEYFMDTKTQRTQYKPTGILFGIITFILALLIDVFLLAFAEDIDFFHEDVGIWTGWIAFAVFNLLFIFGIVATVLSIKNKKRYEQEAAHGTLVRKPNVQEKVEKPVSYEKLFLQEFSDHEEDEEEEEEEKTEGNAFIIKETVDHYHKDGWTLETMQEEMIAFLAERGVVLDALQARTLLAAMNVSRLVVLKTDSGVDVTAFMQAISEFFAVKTYIDDTEDYETSDEMLFYDTADYIEEFEEQPSFYQQTQFATAMEDAAADEAAIKIAHLTSVQLSALGTYFTQFMRYIVKPELTYNINVKNKSISDKTFMLTPNLWIFMALGEEEKVEQLPAYIAETAALIKLRFSTQKPSEEQTQREAVSKAQFLSFGDKAKNYFELEESKWKRVDKLEDYVRARAPYKISNKVWQKMERYASVFLSLGGESEETLDSVVAVKLLANILALIKHNRKENDDEFFHVLENIFGEEKANISRAIIDASSVDVDDKWMEENKVEKPKTKKAKKAREKAVKKVEPVVEETPAIVEVPAVEETPVVAEEPVVEETPAIVEVPAVEETPVVAKEPVVEETPAIVETVEQAVESAEKTEEGDKE